MNRKIVYYHGCAVDYFDQETGRAVIEVLGECGCKVEVPDLICCSFPLLNSGDVKGAHKRATRLTETLARYADSGYEIVYSCPTCGQALKEAYPKLLDSEAARAVAANTGFISTYLANLQTMGELDLEFAASAFRVAYHSPCHLRSQSLSAVSVELLALIPGIEINSLDRGCCGMGGTWALRSRKRSELSGQIGAPLFDQICQSQPEMVATDCFACGIQIARFTSTLPVHPIRLLSEALLKS